MFASVVNGDDMKTKNSLMINITGKDGRGQCLKIRTLSTCIVYAMLGGFSYNSFTAC
jgi:hypothetical protein